MRSIRQVKGLISKLWAKAAENRALRAKRREAIARGKEGVSQGAFLKMIKTVERQTAGMYREASTAIRRRAIVNLATETALDALGILDTPGGPAKRKRIKNSWQRVLQRYRISTGLKAGRETDLIVDAELKNLAVEFGGKKKVKRFLSVYRQMETDIYIKLEAHYQEKT